MSFAFVGRVVQSLKGFYNGINPATLTGAIDVVIVQEEDGTYSSSPFHVRFGKLGVLMLSSSEKVVDIEINGVHSNLQMKLGEAGEAFFVQEVESEEEDVPSYLATSPLPSGMELMERGVLELRRQAELESRKLQQQQQQAAAAAVGIAVPGKKSVSIGIENSDDSPQDAPILSTDEKPRRRVFKKRKPKFQPKSTSAISNSLTSPNNAPNNATNNTGVAAATRSISVPESMLTMSTEEVFELDDVSDSSVDEEVARHMLYSGVGAGAYCSSSPQIKNMDFDNIQGTTSHRMMSTSGNGSFLTPYSDPETSPIGSPMGTRPSTPKSDTELDRQHSESATAFYMADNSATWQWGELPKQASEVNKVNVNNKDQSPNNHKLVTSDDSERDDNAKSPSGGGFMSIWSRPKPSSTIKGSDVTGGIYLDDLTNMDDPEMARIYLGRPRETEDDVESGRGLSLPQSPNSVEGSIGGPCSFTPSEVRHLGPVSLSLCGGLNDPEGVSLEKFMQKVVTFDDLATQPNLTTNPDLVVKIHDKFYNWTAAGPMVLSQIVFQKTLPDPQLTKDTVKHLEKEHMPKKKKKSSWFSWGRSSADPDENDGGIPPTASEGTTNATTAAIATEAVATTMMTSSSPSTNDTNQQTHSLSTTGSGLESMSNSINNTMSTSIPSSESIAVTIPPDDNSLDSSKMEMFPAMSPLSSPPTSASSTPRKIRHNNMAKRQLGVMEDISTSTDTDTSERDLSKLSPPVLPTHQVAATAMFISSSNDAQGGLKAPRRRKKVKYQKTLRLTSAQIKKMNLREGHNEISFSVTTQYQGTTKCVSHVYLWNYDDKIVISDIDGTITKSDVLGQILPIMGRDWSQSGVAQLFTRIHDNGYKLIYLSARAIGQSRSTKDLLKNIKQGDLVLPDGPVFLNPTSLFSAFHREVILKNPEEFKISCLKDIGDLFPSSPFYAGFGNKFNDVIAYRALDIPNFRIFTVNPQGQLRHDLSLTFLSSYSGMSDIVDHFFPSLDYVDRGTSTTYNPVNYWRQPILDITDDELQLLSATPTTSDTNKTKTTTSSSVSGSPTSTSSSAK